MLGLHWRPVRVYCLVRKYSTVNQKASYCSKMRQETYLFIYFPRFASFSVAKTGLKVQIISKNTQNGQAAQNRSFFWSESPSFDLLINPSDVYAVM